MEYKKYSDEEYNFLKKNTTLDEIEIFELKLAKKNLNIYCRKNKVSRKEKAKFLKQIEYKILFKAWQRRCSAYVTDKKQLKNISIKAKNRVLSKTKGTKIK